MRRLSSAAVIAVAAAFATTVVAAPVAAAGPNGRITFVNGVPGQRIDVCINGKEVRGGLRYGGRATRILGSGPKKLKVFRANPRTCRGQKLTQRTFPLDPSGQLTLVITKHAPRVVPFDNSSLGSAVAADDLAVAWRHAADLGDATWHFLADVPITISPTADPIFTKGDEGAITAALLQPSVAAAYVTRPNKAAAFAGPVATLLTGGIRVQWILVGTSLANARIVVIKEKVDFVS